jgi:hypothetical protein
MTINELIATSSVHAFNSGVESGRALELERIIKVLEANDDHTVNLLIKLIKGSEDD